MKGNRITGKFTVACNGCGRNTTTQYARKHEGLCKECFTHKDCNCGPCFREGKGVVFNCTVHPPATQHTRHASREEQHARYIDCGPTAWDDRG